MMTGSQLTMVAPHPKKELSLFRIPHCQGNWFSRAFWPPTILLLTRPQPEVSKVRDSEKFLTICFLPVVFLSSRLQQGSGGAVVAGADGNPKANLGEGFPPLNPPVNTALFCSAKPRLH